jgi:hypothetical protein
MNGVCETPWMSRAFESGAEANDDTMPVRFNATCSAPVPVDNPIVWRRLIVIVLAAPVPAALLGLPLPRPCVEAVTLKAVPVPVVRVVVAPIFTGAVNPEPDPVANPGLIRILITELLAIPVPTIVVVVAAIFTLVPLPVPEPED